MASGTGKPRWLNRREQLMWRTFNEARQQIDLAVERQLAEHSLSGADYAVLVPLSEAAEGAVRARDLATTVSWDRSRLSHQLRRMEERGLIRRFDCDSDARGTMVAITPDGRRAIEGAAPGHVDVVRRHLVSQLSKAEVEQLTQLFGRVRDSARGSADTPRP